MWTSAKSGGEGLALRKLYSYECIAERNAMLRWRPHVFQKVSAGLDTDLA